MILFPGTQTSKVDVKGRLKLPARVRQRFEEAYKDRNVFITSIDGTAVKVFPLKEWEIVEVRLSEKSTDSKEIDGEVKNTDAVGDGPVDAAFNAVQALFAHTARLQLYQVHAVTEGTDAQAEVTVRLEEGGKTVNGQGADTDTMVASVRAYINALNKLLVKREKTAPSALSA